MSRAQTPRLASDTPELAPPDGEDAAVDFSLPADVFWSASARRLTRHGSMRFRGFDTLADAIHFVVSDKSEQRFRCAIDTAEDRYEDDAIDALYNRADFPVHLRSASDRDPAAAPAPRTAYDLRREERGTWTVFEICSGDAAIVDGVLMTRMGEAEASRIAASLNGPDRRDAQADAN